MNTSHLNWYTTVPGIELNQLEKNWKEGLPSNNSTAELFQ